MKGDLHIHSSISDCNYSIEDIVKKAKENGVTHISITDHDTILGIEEALKHGKKYGVEVIPGVEISAYDYKRERKVHILGYKNLGENVKKICEEIPKKREELSRKYFDEIKKKGYDISWERIKKYSGKTGVFKQHIVIDLIKQGYTEKIYGELYQKLFKEETSIKDMEYIDVYKVIKAIKQDGGIAIMAHSSLYKNEKLITELICEGLDGIEIYHPKHSKRDIELLEEIAKENNLLITGGTDFHGDIDSKYIEIGSFYCEEKSLKKIV